MTSRPRPSFRQRPAKEAAIRKTGMPFAATTREGNERGEIAPSGLRAGSLAHAAHTFSPVGESALLGLASITVRSPAIRDGSTRRWFESTDAFFAPRVMPGTDDPSMPGSSTDSAVDGS
jgi:hypothetical protein